MSLVLILFKGLFDVGFKVLNLIVDLISLRVIKIDRNVIILVKIDF